MQRPKDLTILVFLAFIGGLLSFFAALDLFILGNVSGEGVPRVTGYIFGEAAVWLGMASLVSAALSLSFVYGAWKLMPWGWTFGVLSQVFSGLLALVKVLAGSTLVSQLLHFAIAGLILYTLFTPETRRSFRRD